MSTQQNCMQYVKHFSPWVVKAGDTSLFCLDSFSAIQSSCTSTQSHSIYFPTIIPLWDELLCCVLLGARTGWPPRYRGHQCRCQRGSYIQGTVTWL